MKKFFPTLFISLLLLVLSDFCYCQCPVTAVCKDITVHLNNSGEAYVDPASLDNGSTSACLPLTFTSSKSTFTCADIVTSSGDMLITGVFDGPLSGGVPKGIELYSLNAIVDLSMYGVGSANNGGGTDGEEFTFPAVSAAAGQFIYVTNDSAGFRDFFGFDANYVTIHMGINGDDAVELFHMGSVVDVFGDINTDGTGQPWDYMDGWAYRNSGSGPNGGVWDISDWYFSGTNALDGETSNSSATSSFPIATYSNSGIAVSLYVTNPAGEIDSCISLVSVLPSAIPDTSTIIACDSFLWIDGNTYTSSNNTATHTLTNAVGCDSMIILDLTITNNTSGIDVHLACDSLVWIDGNTYYESNNTATHTLTNAAGCDSVITLDLTILSNSSIDVHFACDSLLWIDGNTYYESNNTATHILTNASGCDSAVTLDLTITKVIASDSLICAGDSVLMEVLDLGNSCALLDSNLQVGLVAYWPFCGNANDLSGNGNNGVVSGATLTTDRFGNANCAYEFSGNDIISIPDSINFVLPNFSVSGWVNLAQSTTGYQTIFSNFTGDYPIFSGYHLGLLNDKPSFFLDDGNGFGGVTLGQSLSPLNLNQWYFIVGTYDGVSAKLYLDGNLVESNGYSAEIILAPTDIGNDYLDEVLTGKLDDIGVWNSVLSETEIQQLYLGGSYEIIWSTGDTNSSISVQPTTTTTYSATVSNGVSSCTDSVTITINNSTAIDVQAACDSLTWIDGNTYYASNNTTTHALTNAAGCDSVVTLDLTITNSTSGIDVQTTCDSLTWIDGNTYYASNNTATHTLTNAAGCDSVITLDLTILNNTDTDILIACDSLIWIDGNTYYASNNTATHTLTNASGCDSVVTLDLTITNSTAGIDIQTACDSLTWIDGNTYYASNNTAAHTLTNAAGCDSVVLLDLSIINSTSSTDVQTACNSYLWIDGTTYSASNNTATHILTNAAGCDSVVSLDLTVNYNSVSTDSVVACLEYTWMDGNTYTASTSSPTYTLTNAAGCDSIISLELTINDNNFNPDYTVSSQLFTAPPFAAMFTNNTLNFSDYDFTWDFGDGTILQSNNVSVFHEYLYNGLYDVTLIAVHTTTGCSDTLHFDDYIFCTGGAACSHASTIDQTGPITACLSDSVFLTCNTAPSFTYQWRLNGTYIAGATDTIYYPTQSGNYSVLIMDAGCPEVSPDISITMSLSPTTPVITSTGSITPCIGGSVTMSTTTSYDTYQWSSGGTGATEVVNASGNYTVTVGNALGCETTSAPYTINAAAGSPPNVCIVGIDSATNYNRVVWEKPITSAIDSFYVYKESSAAGVYQKIGGTAYSDTAVFNDLSSNPAVQAYRYRISLLDSCGTESAMGDIHKSIHLTINQGVGTDWNLIWSHYEGFTFPSYNIYRGTSPTSMAPLTTIASTLNSYTDVTAPAGTVYYQIEVVSSYTCDPAKANYNISRSNIADNSGAAGLQDLSSIHALLYPNPTDGRFTLKLQSDISGKVEVTNNIGQVVFNAAINGTATTIDLGEDCSAGLYFVVLYNEYGELVNQQKLIVQ